MKESQIEKNLVKKVKERGGLCYKFISPSNQGVPDRIIIMPNGKIIFVELKTKVGRLAKIQEWQIAEMQKRGADVRIAKGIEQVKSLVNELFPRKE